MWNWKIYKGFRFPEILMVYHTGKDCVLVLNCQNHAINVRALAPRDTDGEKYVENLLIQSLFWHFREKITYIKQNGRHVKRNSVRRRQ